MKNLLKKLTIRKGFIFGVSFLIICNIIFCTCYYYYLTSSNYKTTESLNNELDKEINNLDTSLPKEVFISSLDNISTKNKTSIVLKDKNNNTLYNKKIKNTEKKDSVSKTGLITIDNDEYLITLSKTKNTNEYKMAISFVFFDIIILILLGTAGILGANQKLLSPLTAISNDINNYKLGIKPKKCNAKNKVQEINKTVIATLSHDIKTPLTSILGYSERLNKQELSEDTKAKYANTIYNKSLVMKEIIEDFDDYLTMNTKEPKKDKILIKNLIDYLNKYYKEDLKEKNIDFKIKSNCYNSYIYVDLPKFKRVFSNIISNSIRYLDKSKKQIKIDIKETNDKVKFTIADNGSGSKELKKIFEPLYTTDASRKISGLGLSICKKIIEAHNGTIKAENNKLGGLSIIFEIESYKES